MCVDDIYLHSRFIEDRHARLTYTSIQLEAMRTFLSRLGFCYDIQFARTIIGQSVYIGKAKANVLFLFFLFSTYVLVMIIIYQETGIVVCGVRNSLFFLDMLLLFAPIKHHFSCQ
jgi:hypothetical protein